MIIKAFWYSVAKANSCLKMFDISVLSPIAHPIAKDISDLDA